MEQHRPPEFSNNQNQSACKHATIQDFLEVADSICKRPQMYLAGQSFCEVCAYLLGYSSAMDPYPLGQDRNTSFNDFVTARLGYPQKLAWPYVLWTAAGSDKHAIDLLRNLLMEYLRALQGDRVQDLIAEARTKLESLMRNPPAQVKCWRKFSHALNHGDRATLEELILQNENANVLWDTAYPAEVVPVMDYIEESSAIPVISESEDGSVAEIMSPDYGPLRLVQVDGRWKLDAEPVIRFRMASREDR